VSLSPEVFLSSLADMLMEYTFDIDENLVHKAGTDEQKQ
jgi:hypothetical protein